MLENLVFTLFFVEMPDLKKKKNRSQIDFPQKFWETKKADNVTDFVPIKDTLTAFEDFKNKEKSLWAKVSWCVKAYILLKFI